MRAFGRVAPLAAFIAAAAAQNCHPVGTRSTACGVGQTCKETASGFECTCDYPLSDPSPQQNTPAFCSDKVPIKYISWVTGNKCPFDEHTQCLPPPTKERCAKAANELGLTGANVKAKLESSDIELSGCHYVDGASQPLRYNPNSISIKPASPTDSLICECAAYPIFVPHLAEVGCGTEPGHCKPVKSRFVCGLAADKIGFGVPDELGVSMWNTTLCVANPDAAASTPWLPCTANGAPDCRDPSVATRTCQFVDGAQGGVWEPLGPPTGNLNVLDGCVYHSLVTGEQSPLWYYNPGDETAANSAKSFRLCDCCDGKAQDIIAPRLGYEFVGDGDCAKQRIIGGDCTGQASDLCVELNGDAYIRSDRTDCTRYTTEAQCTRDAVICKWDDATQACDWIIPSFAAEGEVPAHFAECLEYCLLLSLCDSVSFFVKDGSAPGSIGGCDFFSGFAVAGTGETTKVGKGHGEFKCYRYVPDTPTATPVRSTSAPSSFTLPPIATTTSSPTEGQQGGTPTVGPTQSPVYATLPPIAVVTPSPTVGQQAGSPTTSPTLSPVSATTSPSSTCPIGFNIASSSNVECECATFDCTNASHPFKDSNYSFCGRCDDRLAGAAQLRCPVCVPVETQINISCPNSFAACDVFLVVYNQPGCSTTPTSSVNGGFVDNLPELGYVSSSCLPNFCGSCVNSTGGQDVGRHRTVTFFKQVNGGETEALPATTTDPTMYFTVVVNEGRICSTITDREECNRGPGVCLYNEQTDRCEASLCTVISRPIPPPPLCCMQGTPSGDCALASQF